MQYLANSTSYVTCPVDMESAGCEAVGPSSPHKDGPLTPFGIKMVERMNELGMVLDVAHAKIETLKGIAEITKAPLIDSHTKHCSHKR